MRQKKLRIHTVEKGTKAPQAAGKIHSDIERGFIRAETINFDEMMALAAAWPPPRRRACCGPRARSMWSRTAI